LRRYNNLHGSVPLWERRTGTNVFDFDLPDLQVPDLSINDFNMDDNEHSCYSTPAIRNTTSSILIPDEDD